MQDANKGRFRVYIGDELRSVFGVGVLTLQYVRMHARILRTYSKTLLHAEYDSSYTYTRILITLSLN